MKKLKYTLSGVKPYDENLLVAGDRPLPRVWFFAVGNDRILRSRHSPEPFIVIPNNLDVRLYWISKRELITDSDRACYRLVEINECDRVAVYR
jgi:hypothetical protein